MRISLFPKLPTDLLRLAIVLAVGSSLVGCSQRPARGVLSDPAMRAIPKAPIETPAAPERLDGNPEPDPSPSPSASPAPSPSPTKGSPSSWPAGVHPKPPTDGGRIGDDTVAEKYDLLTILTRPFSQSVGFYARGKIEKADRIEDETSAHLKLFRARDRGYGSLDLISILEDASKEVRQQFPASERIQIGDLSARYGGAGTGHKSHQNGLDADVVFLRRDHREMKADETWASVTGFDEKFVSRGKLTANFDIEANWRMIQLLVSTGRVDRIFVDRVIKAAFCAYAVERGSRAEWTETLRRLRHEENHQDHMHVRLTCPAKSAGCKGESLPPPGDGCDPYLDRDARAGFLNFELSPAEVDPNEAGC